MVMKVILDTSVLLGFRLGQSENAGSRVGIKVGGKPVTT
jgi:hypothetical protein